jgi:hypothetical protein
MQNNGLPCQIEVHADLGHKFPADFRHSLDQALKFILSGDT